jgi:hypothetical protein
LSARLKITMRAQRALEKLEHFDPVTQHNTGFHTDQRKQSRTATQIRNNNESRGGGGLC